MNKMWPNFKKIFKKKNKTMDNSAKDASDSEEKESGTVTPEPNRSELAGSVSINRATEPAGESLPYASTPPIPIPIHRKIT